jgi:ribosomal protein L25 (general stress protein Ctc)
MEVLSSSETSDLTRVTRRNIPEDAIVYSHCRENLKSYINKQTLWLLVRKQTIPTEKPPRKEKLALTFAGRECCVVIRNVLGGQNKTERCFHHVGRMSD